MIVALYTASEISWIQFLLHELGLTTTTMPIICCATRTTYPCANPVFHSRMEYIAIYFHFERDKLQNGSLHVSHVSSYDQLIDALIKPLSRLKTWWFTGKIDVHSICFILKGHNRNDSDKSKSLIKKISFSCIYGH